MVSMESIKQELESNEVELKIAIDGDRWLRAFELKLQRDLLKESLILILEQELNGYLKRKVG